MDSIYIIAGAVALGFIVAGVFINGIRHLGP